MLTKNLTLKIFLTISCMNSNAPGYDMHTTIVTYAQYFVAGREPNVQRNIQRRIANAPEHMQEEGRNQAIQAGLGEFYQHNPELRGNICIELLLTGLLYAISTGSGIAGLAMGDGIAAHHPHAGIYYYLLIPGILCYIAGSIIHRIYSPLLGIYIGLFGIGICTHGISGLSHRTILPGLDLKDIL